jgi:hypothetical protein
MTASVWLNSALASLISVTLACSDSTGPGPSPEVFVLRQVQQDLLPTVMSQNEFFVIRVLSDTIRLRGDGTGNFSGVRESVPSQGGSGEGPVHIGSDLHYRVIGTRVEIDFDCPDMAICVPPPHLIANSVGDQLTASWGPHMSGRSPLVYEKVAP